MTDYRVGNEKGYYKSHIPGILRGSVVATSKEHPLFICYFCGGKAGQIRGDKNQQFISRGCRKVECRTLASMHSQEDWGNAPEIKG